VFADKAKLALFWQHCLPFIDKFSYISLSHTHQNKGVFFMTKNGKLRMLSTITLIVITILITNVAYAEYKPDFQNIKMKTIEYLNKLRARNNLQPVKEDAKAMKVAQKRADFQKGGNLSHNRLEKDLEDIKKPIYGTENLAYLHPQQYGSDDATAKAAVILWYIDEGIENKGHHKQMLNPVYDITGVGIKQGQDGYIYISQVLASTEDIDPDKVSEELVEVINEFYDYFNSKDLKPSKPLE
jgi:uncharacterized protein YkwD